MLTYTTQVSSKLAKGQGVVAKCDMAHTVIHALRQILAPNCLPLFTSDGLNLYFSASPGSFWTLARSESSRAERTPVAGGGGPDLRSGEEKLSAAQAAAGQAHNAS